MGIVNETTTEVCKYDTSEKPHTGTTGGDRNTPENDPTPVINNKTGACPSFRDTCTGNLSSSIYDSFSAAGTSKIIDNEDLDGFYNIANTVANDRKFTTIAEPTNIDNNNIIDNDDYETLRDWVNSVVYTPGTAEYKADGDEIDSAGWMSIRDKLIQVAAMCNTVNQCSCNSVCSCDQVCSCNCDSNY